MRRYVAEKVGTDYLVPLLGCYNSAAAVDFDGLPQQFVLKSNHGSSQVKIVKDKSQLDIEGTREELANWLDTDFYRFTKERQYKDISRKIIVEKLLTTSDGQIPYDYKFHCFNGVVRSIQVDLDRFNGHKRNFYDRNWVLQPFIYCKFGRLGNPKHPQGRPVPRPEQLGLMMELAEKLASGQSYVRVDMYSFARKIFFGELTLHHGSGFERFLPSEYDHEWFGYLNV
ncbi:MAG: hypothetical protein JXM68_08415 [Sedimentisphaerales bacterium]|nr:hypothetical protein [Sedimentisphaerales bacterium]